MPFNHINKDSQFWINVLGNEAISIWESIEQRRFVEDDASGLSLTFHVDAKLLPLKILEAFGFINMTSSKKREKIVYQVVPSQQPKIPGWSSFIHSLAKAISCKAIGKTMMSKMRWDLLSVKLDESTEMLERVGLGYIETVGIFLNTSGSPSKPFILVNGNQKVLENGYHTIRHGSHTQCIFSHKINKEAKHEAGVLIIPDASEPDGMVVKVKPEISWKNVAVEDWNAKHFSFWICDKYKEINGKNPPFNIVNLFNCKIKSDGIKQLARMNSVSDASKMNLDYKKFAEWLFNHPRFLLSPQNLTSNWIMTNYILEMDKSKSVKSSKEIGSAFNMKESDYD